MTAIQFAFFVVGIRITQLFFLSHLVDDLISHDQRVLVEDLTLRQACSFLTAAFERLAQVLGLSPEMTRHGHQLIAEGKDAWKTCTFRREDRAHLIDALLLPRELERFIGELATSLGSAGAAAHHWLELGLVVADGEDDDSLSCEERAWNWRHPELLDQRLELVGLTREDVFPSCVDSRSRDAWTILPGKFVSWTNVEAGIMNLAARVVPCVDLSADDRLLMTVPELAKYIIGSSRYKAAAESNERLVRKWIGEGRVPAKRVKRGLYSVRASHLEILRDVHRTD